MLCLVSLWTGSMRRESKNGKRGEGRKAPPSVLSPVFHGSLRFTLFPTEDRQVFGVWVVFLTNAPRPHVKLETYKTSDTLNGVIRSSRWLASIAKCAATGTAIFVSDSKSGRSDIGEIRVQFSLTVKFATTSVSNRLVCLWLNVLKLYKECYHELPVQQLLVEK